MPTNQTAEAYLQALREYRSSEGNFETIHTTLTEAINNAQHNNNTTLAEDLKEVDEKYASEYKNARQISGSAWPEFEKFVTQFERTLTKVQKDESET